MAVGQGGHNGAIPNRTDGDLQFYFEVRATGASSNPPAISNLAAGSISSSGASVSWDTDQPASGQVQYGTTTAYAGSTTLNPTLATGHAQQLSGLVAGTLYHYRVLSTNASGNQAVSGDSTFTTSAVAPVVSDISVLSITSSGAIVSWTTDQSADGRVDYGLTTAYGSSTTYNPALATSHAQQISGLVAGMTYHYRIRSTNTTGAAVSADGTFTTLTVPPVISNVTAGSVTSSGAVVSWGDRPKCQQPSRLRYYCGVRQIDVA